MKKIYNTIHAVKNKLNGIPNPDTTNFCYYPFFEVVLTSDGKYKPCSKHNDYITDKDKIIDVNTSTINDAWNSDYMKDIRATMLRNERHAGCVECWREQDNGVKPMRYDSFNYNIPRKQVKNTQYPMRVEINASNVCNLKCRICTSFASTKWMAEEKALFGNSQEVTHFNLTKENLQQIIEWLPHIEEIGLFGGEPFLSEENLDLLRYCIISGEAKHIRILVNTNTTVYTDEIATLLKGFKKVYLNFSIDDIGERFEYQRKGAKWNEVVENLKKYTAIGGYKFYNKIECKICCTVTNMNIFYFPEYFEFMNKHFPGLPVFWNLLYNPIEYSVQILPIEVKNAIKKRLQKEIKATYKMEETRTKTIETLITYLDYEEEGNFDDFFKVIDRHDVYRKEKFSAVFPEFWHLIEQYENIKA